MRSNDVIFVKNRFKDNCTLVTAAFLLNPVKRQFGEFALCKDGKVLNDLNQMSVFFVKFKHILLNNTYI